MNVSKTNKVIRCEKKKKAFYLKKKHNLIFEFDCRV